MNLLPEDSVTYDRGSLLGGGGFATVYKGSYYGSPVAVKIFKNIHSNQQLMRTLVEEVQIHSGLRHPGIVEFFGCIKYSSGDFGIVMQLLTGGSLRSAVEANRLTTWEEKLTACLDVARAIAFLHSRSPPIIHCDVKPDNVLIEPLADSFRCKVTDFGISKPNPSAEHGVSLSGISYQYSAPEIATVGARATKETDVFAIGSILYFLVMGVDPFEGLPVAQIGQRLKAGVLPALPAAVPAWTHKMLAACWNMDPAARWPATRLVEFLSSEHAQLQRRKTGTGFSPALAPSPNRAPASVSTPLHAPSVTEMTKTARQRANVPVWVAQMQLHNMRYGSAPGWGSRLVSEINLLQPVPRNKFTAWTLMFRRLVETRNATNALLSRVSNVWLVASKKSTLFEFRISELGEWMDDPALRGDFTLQKLPIGGSKTVSQTHADINRRRKMFDVIREIMDKSFHVGPNRNSAGVLAFHGCQDFPTAQSIASKGPAAVRKLDAGYFGVGFYTTHELEYALEYAKPQADGRRYVVLMLLAVGSVFPVVEHPRGPSSLMGKPIFPKFNAHCSIVRKRGAKMSTYVPVDAGQERAPGAFIEYVLQETDVLPLAVLEVLPRPIPTVRVIAPSPQETHVLPVASETQPVTPQQVRHFDRYEDLLQDALNFVDERRLAALMKNEKWISEMLKRINPPGRISIERALQFSVPKAARPRAATAGLATGAWQPSAPQNPVPILVKEPKPQPEAVPPHPAPAPVATDPEPIPAPVPSDEIPHISVHVVEPCEKPAKVQYAEGTPAPPPEVAYVQPAEAKRHDPSPRRAPHALSTDATPYPLDKIYDKCVARGVDFPCGVQAMAIFETSIQQKLWKAQVAPADPDALPAVCQILRTEADTEALLVTARAYWMLSRSAQNIPYIHSPELSRSAFACMKRVLVPEQEPTPLALDIAQALLGCLDNLLVDPKSTGEIAAHGGLGACLHALTSAGATDARIALVAYTFIERMVAFRLALPPEAAVVWDGLPALLVAAERDAPLSDVLWALLAQAAQGYTLPSALRHTFTRSRVASEGAALLEAERFGALRDLLTFLLGVCKQDTDRGDEALSVAKLVGGALRSPIVSEEVRVLAVAIAHQQCKAKCCRQYHYSHASLVRLRHAMSQHPAEGMFLRACVEFLLDLEKNPKATPILAALGFSEVLLSVLTVLRDTPDADPAFLRSLSALFFRLSLRA
eukprot:gnl/Chilomastix_cuspidata/194.p1 GENE.gnl/Chilomastix_cuspidata/194~~gnl/Chilomastix_cuspidata/194.p1  ORF type:complete len:1211 (+),score=517.45 gnl/Chilomastix_cuspidata/194:3110-6742(+)